MRDDYTNISLSAVACNMLMEDLARQRSATSLIHNAERTVYDLSHGEGSRSRLRLEVEENESYWSARRFCVNPDEDNAQKPPKAATHTLLLWEPTRTVLCPWWNQMDREAVLVELRRERNRQRKKNKKQESCLQWIWARRGDSWPSTLALIDLSVLIQCIKNLLCRYTCH